MNVSVHKQLVDLLEEAGTTGMTLTVSQSGIESMYDFHDYNDRSCPLHLVNSTGEL
jgi:hypothetical protein